MNTTQESELGEVILYTNPDGSTAVGVRLELDTVWLSQAQMADLFDRDRDTISEHIQNIFKEGELSKTSTTRKFRAVRTEGTRQVERTTDFYNLDAIISVGYRVNSKKGTQFRIWASSVLKDHLLQGYSFNKAKLTDDQVEQFKQALSLFPQAVEQLSARGELNSDESVALMQLVTEYATSWALLQQYDDGSLETVSQGAAPHFVLDYATARKAINALRQDLMQKQEASDLFGNERDESFKGLLGNIYQTFGGDELYTSIEQKAAHLLYFIIKDHPFSDGNKRTGALLFIYFLNQNDFLNKKTGERKINDNALVALALLIAESNPKQKELMIALVMHLLK